MNAFRSVAVIVVGEEVVEVIAGGREGRAGGEGD